MHMCSVSNVHVLGYHSDISMFIGSHPSGQQSFNLNVQTPLRHDSCHDSFQSDTSLENSWHKDKALSPFCSVDQMQLSIHCHINAVKCLMCVPAQLQEEVGEWVDSDVHVCIWLFVGSCYGQQCHIHKKASVQNGCNSTLIKRISMLKY